MSNNFKVNDIKSNYVIELRNGTRLFVMRINQNRFIKVLANSNSLIPLGEYETNLKHKKHAELDIICVYGLSMRFTYNVLEVAYRPILWKRPDPKKLTISEIEILLGYPVEIVREG